MNNNGATYSLRALIIYFLKLGTWGFGGPVALAGYMHRDLVEKRGWISEQDYREGLALAQLAPGPLAAQLGIYMGYIHYRLWGATLAGLAFVLPSFLMVVALGFIYTRWQGIPQIQAIFYGVGAAVIGIIGVSAFKLTTKSVGHDKPLWVIFTVSAIYTIWREEEHVILFLASGIFYWLLKSPPKSLLLALRHKNASKIFPFLVVLDVSNSVSGNILWKIALFFAKAGAFVFGSGLAIVPFLYSGIVREHAWLNEQQFMDAVAVAMITPGPVVITVGFIGYLVAGFPGASVAAIATFFPCYIFTILPAPYFRKYGNHPGIKAFVDGVTAAAIGAICGAVIILAKRSLVDLSTICIAVSAAFILWKYKKVPEPAIIFVAALIGLLLKLFQNLH